MKILPPFEVTPSNLTSNVPITETEWTAGTYATGVQRYQGVTLYEVVADPDTTDEPVVGVLADPPTWIEVGAINRFKMFSNIIGDATVGDGDIEVTIDSDGTLINGVALFQMAAQTVQVIVTDAVEGVVYDETRDLQDVTGINNWYAYFFQPYNLATSAVFTDLPAYLGAEVTVIIDNTTDDAKVGELIVGRQQNLGVTLQNFSFGIEDFSRKERDVFGNFSIIERRFAKLANYDVFLENNQVNNTFNALARVRAQPVVYIGGDDFPESVTLGFYRNFDTLRTGPVTSEMTIEIEGLV